MSTQTGIPVDPKQNDRPDELPEGARIERRADGSVWQVRPAIPVMDEKTGKPKPGPDTLEFRVDSPKDIDFIAKGGNPWYYKYLDEAAPNATRGDSTQDQLNALMARLDKAEARAEAAEAAVAATIVPSEPIDQAAIERADPEITESKSAPAAEIAESNSAPAVEIATADAKPAAIPVKGKGKTKSKSKK